jgi:hypothetical protein
MDFGRLAARDRVGREDEELTVEGGEGGRLADGKVPGDDAGVG